MIIHFILFSLLLISLFLLSQKISNSIYNSVFVITKNRNFALGILVVLLLPGTIIHELSHFLVATILHVRTGELTVIPTIEKSGEVKAGKLFLGATDPFRFSLVGLAPIIIGLFLIYLVGKSFLPYLNLLPFTPGESFRLPQGWFWVFVICYLLFVISVTMFSSKKDIAGLKFAVPIILLILISLYVAGIRVLFDKSLTGKIEIFLADLNYYLLLTTVLDSLTFLIFSTILYLIKRLL